MKNKIIHTWDKDSWTEAVELKNDIMTWAGHSKLYHQFLLSMYNGDARQDHINRELRLRL